QVPFAQLRARLLIGIHRRDQKSLDRFDVEVVGAHEILDVPHAEHVRCDVLLPLVSDRVQHRFQLLFLPALCRAFSPLTTSLAMSSEALPTQSWPPSCTRTM